jgi:hypothetical protein
MVGGGEGRPGRVVAEWAASVGGPAGADLLAGQAVVCDLLAGDAACDAEAWLRIADVIICRPGPAAGLPAVLRSVLSRYPGCAVAAAGLDGSVCLVSAPGHDPRQDHRRTRGWPAVARSAGMCGVSVQLACGRAAAEELALGPAAGSLARPGWHRGPGRARDGAGLVQRELCIRRPGLA